MPNYTNPRHYDRRATIYGIEREAIRRRFVRDVREIGGDLFGLCRHKRQVYMVRQTKTDPYAWVRVEYDEVSKEWRDNHGTRTTIQG